MHGVVEHRRHMDEFRKDLTEEEELTHQFRGAGKVIIAAASGMSCTSSEKESAVCGEKERENQRIPLPSSSSTKQQ